jgi:HTH-type transcriptional regulator/antitoxin HigA
MENLSNRLGTICHLTTEIETERERMPTILDQITEQEYLQLVRDFPLVSIRDNAHLSEALVVMDRLLDMPEHTPAQEVYLGALTDLIETFENAHFTIPPVSGVAALRYLMAENELSQADLASLFGGPSVISEVLSGKRRLALAHITRLAAHFGLPADVFISD